MFVRPLSLTLFVFILFYFESNMKISMVGPPVARDPEAIVGSELSIKLGNGITLRIVKRPKK